MPLPLFNYHKIISATTDYPELDIENSMLMLHWNEQSKTTDMSAEMKNVLTNFDMWRTNFILNNDAVFSQGSKAEKKNSSITYSSLMAKCLLRAEFYPWRSFKHNIVRAEDPMLTWRNSTLQCSKAIKDLL